MTISGMTGFFAARGSRGGTSWAWEAKSVNGRGLDVRVRVPAGFEALDDVARQAVAKRFKRGSFQLNLAIDSEQAPLRYRLNQALLDSLLTHAQEMVRAGVAAPASAHGLLNVKGVLEAETHIVDEADLESLRAFVAQTLDEALAGLQDAREQEGRTLSALLSGIVGTISQHTAAAKDSADAAPEVIRARLTAKIAELLGGASIDPARLAQEAALLAIKADVREELDRLDAHAAEARKLLASGGAQGRRLDFLAQEFNREANTLCSKSSSVELTRIGLDLKAAVDQLREQAQNVE